MKSEQYKRDLVAQLKREKAKTGMTYQEIADKTESLGAAVSVRTISKVLSSASNEINCKISTILCIAQAMGVEPIAEKCISEDAIRLEEAQKQLASYAQQTESMRKVINEHEAHIAKLLHDVHKKDRRIVILTVSLCVILLAAALLLGFDILQPNVGYIK